MLDRFLFIFFFTYSAFAIDFLFNSFTSNDLIFTGDARVESSAVTLTSNDAAFSIGRAFYPNSIVKFNNNTFSSFSTSFVFSIRPEISTSPGFGLAFVISNTTVPRGALSGQYFGVFDNSSISTAGPLLVVEFDTGRNPEFNDPDRNHIGIDLNSVESVESQVAGFYNSTTGEFIPIQMHSGSNIRAWIEFDGIRSGINVTIAPVGVSRPSKPLISFYSPIISNYVSSSMFVGFSASKTTWKETQRILAWSLSDEGFARDINTSSLPTLRPQSSSSSSLSSGVKAGIIVICITIPILLVSVYWFWLKKRKPNKDDEDHKIQDWELEYWPHRFAYEELARATKGFSKDELLGSGGFGEVYKGTLANNIEIAVKCVNHDSNQGLREFMAEISSIGRLQHRNLVHMQGWCKKGRELMLVYDYMPNGSFNGWIFSKSRPLMGWEGRVQVLQDVAEGLSYLHHGWDHLVLHRDIKTSNILLDSGMRGRLGDFGLAKLYKHGQAPATTRLVGTIGYMAPELVFTSSTAASDVYSFGVVVLEAACGRRPTHLLSDDDPPLIDWVRGLLEEGRLLEAADWRLGGEYNKDDMELVLNLGLRCCNPDPQLRPTMKEVVALLSAVATLPFSSGLLLELPSGNISVTGDESPGSKLSCMTDPGPRT
ncbi:L-type lectin-domain containing receptor kinase S.1-like [Actinidia eriantha]|uniref:L-type lectin-domain containing receptor kinase S.1-like n=1 Tax=Actinidia eriantha TaxID=165200 RepID=UPI00258845A0|nr:L-type lectin-domain containing receptor kinase S.1-like [Actinidia eriantha]